MCEPRGSLAEMTGVTTRVPRPWPRRLLLLAVVTVVVGGTWLSRGGRAGAWLVEQEGRLEAWHDQHTLLSCGVALVLYVVVTGFSIPVATLLSLALGRLLGFWPAVAVVSFGSSTGATLAMLLCRTLFRESVLERMGPRGERLLRGFERHGAFYLFTLRMMPQVPFVLVNLAMSVSSIRARTFFLVSQLGMLPATCLYVFTGSQLPSLDVVARGEVGEILTWPLIVGLVLLGCFPLVVRLCWPNGSVSEDGSASGDGLG